MVLVDDATLEFGLVLGLARLGIIAAFPPRRYSHEVKRLIPGAFTLSHQDIRNSLLPDTVIEATSGRKFNRPREWQ